MSRDSITEQSLSETNKSLSEQLELAKKELSRQTSRSKKLEAQVKTLKMALTSSPSATPQTAPLGETAAETATESATAKRTLDVDDVSDEEPQKKQARTTANAPTNNAFGLMIDAAAVNRVDINSITIQTELERLFSEGVFQARKRQADENGEKVPKRALFDSQNKYFFGANPHMLLDNKGGKKANTNAMTVAAIAFPDRLWEQMFNDDKLDMAGVRRIASAVNSSVADKIKNWEINHCGRKEDGGFRPLKNQRAVSGKWKEVVKALMKTRYKTEEQFQAWVAKELGETVKGRQTTITGLFNTGARDTGGDE
jgi:hypothetical protein